MPYYTVIFGLFSSNIFFHIISKETRFSVKKIMENIVNVCLFVLYKFCLKHFLLKKYSAIKDK